MLAVIPAAGKASRFGGIYKELLPVGPGKYLLSAAIERAKGLGAEHAIVVSRPHKAEVHSSFLGENPPAIPTRIVLQTDNNDLWGAIRTTLYHRERSVLVMPDTVFAATSTPPRSPISFGVFRTHQPERYSVLKNGTIYTKDQHLKGPHWAWGVVCWSSEVAEYWLSSERKDGPYSSYDEAFRRGIQEFGAGGFELEWYEDLGTWASYQRFVATGGLQ